MISISDKALSSQLRANEAGEAEQVTNNVAVSTSVAITNLPEQLKNPAFRFCKIQRGQKYPFEREWQKNGYSYLDILGWLNKGNNCGILGGAGDIIIVDCDCRQTLEVISKAIKEGLLPKSFTVKTSKAFHIYYLCPGIDKKLIFDDTKSTEKDSEGKPLHLGEIISHGAQAVCPGSLHPSGAVYAVARDYPIATITKEQLFEAVAELLPAPDIHKQEYYDFSNRRAEVDSIRIEDVISKYGIKLTQKGKELVGAHPKHGSTTGINFSVNTEKQTWHCFRHNTGGNAVQLIALMENIIPCELAGKGSLDKEKFIQTLKSWGIEVHQKQGSEFYGKSKQVETPTEEWPEPEDILAQTSLLPVMPYSCDMLPPVFDEHIKDVSDRMQSPPDYLAAAHLVGLSSVIAYRINIKPKKHDNWIVVPNLWGLIVGPPSSMKTPTLNEALKPLRALEISAEEEYQQNLARYDTFSQMAMIAREAVKDEAKKALKSTDPQKNAAAKQQTAIEILEASKKSIKEEVPIRKRYILSDGSIEKHQITQMENQGKALLRYRDELPGFIAKLDQQGRESERAYIIESWAGDSDFRYETKNGGVNYLPHNTLSILGGAQPAKAALLFHDAIKNTDKNDGFAQRFQISVYPDIKKSFKLVDRSPDQYARNKVHEVYKYLDSLQPETIGAKKDSDDGLWYLQFAEDAQALFYDWYIELKSLTKSGTLPDYLESHFEKYSSLVPSIALIIHLAQGNTGSVTLQATKKAIKWADYLKSHALRIYATAKPQEEYIAKLIAQKILSKEIPEEFTVRALYMKCWSGITSETAEPALNVLQEAGWGKLLKTTPNHEKGGRPSASFRINPKVWKYQNNEPTKLSKPPFVGFVGSIKATSEVLGGSFVGFVGSHIKDIPKINIPEDFSADAPISDDGEVLQ